MEVTECWDIVYLMQILKDNNNGLYIYPASAHQKNNIYKTLNLLLSKK